MIFTLLLCLCLGDCSEIDLKMDHRIIVSLGENIHYKIFKIILMVIGALVVAGLLFAGIKFGGLIGQVTKLDPLFL